MILRNYQNEIVERIQKSTDRKNCVQLPTGAGKTAIFSHLAKESNGRVLILVNRVELLQQTIETIKNNVEGFEAKSKTIPSEKIVVGMVETVARRPSFEINVFDLVIVDECHNLQFVKVIEKFNGRLLGFTATPTTDKVVYFEGEDGFKYRRNISLLNH